MKIIFKKIRKNAEDLPGSCIRDSFLNRMNIYGKAEIERNRTE